MFGSRVSKFGSGEFPNLVAALQQARSGGRVPCLAPAFPQKFPAVSIFGSSTPTGRNRRPSSMFGTGIPTEVPCSVSLPAMEHTPSPGPTGMHGQMHRVRKRVRLQGKAVGRAGRRSARETSGTLGESRPRPADGQMARVAGIPSWGPSPHALS